MPKKAKAALSDKKAEKKRAERLVTFEIKSEALTGRAAKEVLLVGSFDGWKREGVPLKKSKNGTWVLKLPLEPGRYEYRYLVDGNWVSDENSPTISNPFGSTNNVVEVV